MPYYPRRPGLFENIIRGANTVLGIASVIKGFQNQSAMQENRELQNTTSRVGLAQKIAELTNQPVSMESMAGRLEKAGIPWPKTTPESQVQAQDTAIRAAGPVPEGVERIGQERGRGIASRVAETMPVGGAMPIMPQGNKVGILGREGGFRVENLPPGVKRFMTQPSPPVSYGVFDERTGKITPTGNMRTTILKKQKTAQELADEAEAKAKGRYRGTPDIPIVDDRGIPIGSAGKRRPVKSSIGKPKTKIFMTNQEIMDAQNRGEVLPSNVVKIKDQDAENLKTARGRALSAAKGMFDLSDPEQKDKMNKFVNDQTEVELGILKGKKKGGSQSSWSPPVSDLKEGMGRKYSDGSMWTLKNGVPTKVK